MNVLEKKVIDSAVARLESYDAVRNQLTAERKKVQELRTALKPFAIDVPETYKNDKQTVVCVYFGSQLHALEVGHFRVAKNALTELSQPTPAPTPQASDKTLKQLAAQSSVLRSILKIANLQIKAGNPGWEGIRSECEAVLGESVTSVADLRTDKGLLMFPDAPKSGPSAKTIVTKFAPPGVIEAGERVLEKMYNAAGIETVPSAGEKVEQEKVTCGVLYRRVLKRFCSTQHDVDIFAAGFVSGEAEKVYLGACIGAMFRPEKENYRKLFDAVSSVAELYGLKVTVAEDGELQEIWITRPNNAWHIYHMQKAKVNSAAWHESRGKICGIPITERDPNFHERRGYQEPCDSIEPTPPATDQSVSAGEGVEQTGVELIWAERNRQLHAEGWTSEHDDEHTRAEMAYAAACYALPLIRTMKTVVIPGSPRSPATEAQVPANWPWDAEWWKPTPNDRVRELVKAGALIAAEIDRLQRASEPTPPADANKVAEAEKGERWFKCVKAVPETPAEVGQICSTRSTFNEWYFLRRKDEWVETNRDGKEFK